MGAAYWLRRLDTMLLMHVHMVGRSIASVCLPSVCVSLPCASPTLPLAFICSAMSDTMIMDAIASHLVLPNRLTIPLVADLQVAQLRSPLPRVTVSVMSGLEKLSL